MARQINLESYMKARMHEMDEHHLDPDQRAELVNTFIFHALGLSDQKDVIEQPLYWDLLCYCFQMLLKYAVQMNDEGLFMAMRTVNTFMHSLHYSGEIGEEGFLGPSREEHEGIWVDRIEFIKAASEWKKMEDSF